MTNKFVNLNRYRQNPLAQPNGEKSKIPKGWVSADRLFSFETEAIIARDLGGGPVVSNGPDSRRGGKRRTTRKGGPDHSSTAYRPKDS